ncbi:ABC transporter permease [Thermoanaerobacterium thermosaccharolyticum]|uniref:ABC-type transport system, involved in lipoprotein release, permease component n=1 Tax=Thermoanaerobacterium thermosaccharolyticum M0795 TaxID=698948 RepID=L0IJZ4_THETR|nr:ABC transporter permease [Thermoanaerobacterium thermosaccharolyticum]AGB19089.1 ABC-type transport system, involved in lipoprotein release, permease component [Thermoanaerobacterium thermosaccharolyticum M0795]
MKVYIHLALAYLKKQRGRTIALVLGVALAVMLVFGTNVIFESQSRNQLANIYKMYGTYQGIFTNLNKDLTEKIKNDKDVSKSAVAANLGNLVTDNGISIILNSTDKDYIEMNGYTLTKGHLPNKQGEIVLESQALKKMGLKEKLGETINFKIKKEYKDENGLNQIYMENKSFKLVGILDKPKQYYEGYYSLRGFTYFKEGENNVLPDNLITYEEIVKLKSKANLSGQLNQIRERYNIGRWDYDLNIQLVTALDDYSSQNTNASVRHFNILIVITAILLIYNMFNISLIDMIKQIGMMRAIGSSKKQVRLIIGFQSLFIFIIGLSLGLLMGIAFSYIGMKLFNFAFLDVSQSTVYISAKNIWNALIVGTATVILSSIIPIWMSGMISPIEAMRKSDRSGGKQRNRGYHKFIKKISGITGEMAYKNVWRNKWRAIIIVVSVAMAGYLFIDDIAFLNNRDAVYNTTPYVLNMQDYDFKLLFGPNIDLYFTGYTNDDVKAISQIEGVKKVGTKVSMEGFLESDVNDLENDFKKYNGISDTKKNVETMIEVKGYDDDQLQGFKKYIDKGDMSSLNNSSDKYPNAVVYNYYYDIFKHKLKGIRKDLKVGDIMTIRIPVIRNGKIAYEDKNIRVGALLKQEWIAKGDSTRGARMEIILPQKYLMTISGKSTYDQISVQSEAGKDTYVYNRINKILENKPFAEMESKLSYIEKSQKGFTGVLKSDMVIVALILLIAGMNVYNTLKTNLLIRTNEFATLRAIGMTAKQLKSMIIKESIIYGLLSSIIAALIGSYNVYSFYSLVNRQYKAGFNISERLQFKLPVIPILLYSAIVIVICILSSYVSAKKVEKLNIVEGLNITE